MTIPNYDRRIKTGKSQPANLEHLKILVLHTAIKALQVFVCQVFTLMSTHFVEEFCLTIMFSRKTQFVHSSEIDCNDCLFISAHWKFNLTCCNFFFAKNTLAESEVPS